ncbi:MAG: DHH family phosphoesterase [Bacteroidales bacterium]
MISKIIDESKIQQTKKAISKHKKIVILAHQSPDGDAIGSSLAMYHFLLELEKDVQIIVPDGFPSFLGWLKGSGEILIYDKYPQYAQEAIEAADLILCMDFNSHHRIGEALGQLLQASNAKKILIDHHLDPSSDFDVSLSYPSMCATGEVVFRLICRMGYFEEINRDCAEAIYTAMMTDTGRFSYNSDSPEIYYIIAELIKKGVNKDEIVRRVFQNESLDRIRLRGFIQYEKLKVLPELQSAYITLTDEEQQRFNLVKGDTEGLVNIPLDIKGINCSAFFKEDKESNKIKVSLRSIGNIAVNELSNKYFNGGGHKNAAGGSWNGSMEEAVALFERVIADYISK